MRCYICDVELVEVHMDENHKALPCPVCLDAVNEALQEFEEDNDYANYGFECPEKSDIGIETRLPNDVIESSLFRGTET